jgi:uncharacterized membrane protein SpoIIM required for sporulation
MVFSQDTILREYSGILVVTFTVICSLPFMYYLIKLEEKKDLEISSEGSLIREHYKAIKAMVWLFLGFVLAFSLVYIIFEDSAAYNFNAQIKVFCAINNPNNFDYCIKQNGINSITGNVAKSAAIMSIFSNNIYVLVFTIIFSLAFGAGAIFVLAWNASVIAAAIGIFTKGEISHIPLGFLRYMIHGIPEIAAYFFGALAGGIISIAVIRKDMRGDNMWKITQDSLILVMIAIAILFLAALAEVFITPRLFG